MQKLKIGMLSILFVSTISASLSDLPRIASGALLGGITMFAAAGGFNPEYYRNLEIINGCNKAMHNTGDLLNIMFILTENQQPDLTKLSSNFKIPLSLQIYRARILLALSGATLGAFGGYHIRKISLLDRFHH